MRARSTPPAREPPDAATPAGARAAEPVGMTVGPLRRGQERTFFALYRRHPGVSPWYGASREALEAAAREGVDAGMAYLLARLPSGPAGALALRRQAGGRALCFFPVLARHAGTAVLPALGAAALDVARQWGSRVIEAEIRALTRTRQLESHLPGLGLTRVTERLEMVAPAPRLPPPATARLQAHAPRALMPLLREAYRGSADPAVRDAAPEDDLALMEEEHPRMGAWLLERDGRAAGICLGAVAGRRGRILFTGLAPDHRGRGLGKVLLRGSLAALGAAGARSVSLAVSLDNAPALALYRSLGFRGTRRLRLYRRAVS